MRFYSGFIVKMRLLRLTNKIEQWFFILIIIT